VTAQTKLEFDLGMAPTFGFQKPASVGTGSPILDVIRHDFEVLRDKFRSGSGSPADALTWRYPHRYLKDELCEVMLSACDTLYSVGVFGPVAEGPWQLECLEPNSRDWNELRDLMTETQAALSVATPRVSRWLTQHGCPASDPSPRVVALLWLALDLVPDAELSRFLTVARLPLNAPNPALAASRVGFMAWLHDEPLEALTRI
jgi:hypothetical protein